MLNENAAARPTAREVLIRSTAHDLADTRYPKQTIFAPCCTNTFVSQSMMANADENLSGLQSDLHKAAQKRVEMQQDI